MNQAHVHEISFPAQVETRNGPELQGARIVVFGSPSELVEKAREIALSIFQPLGRWHFDSLEFESPVERGLGMNRDDGWRCTAIAVLKPQ